MIYWTEGDDEADGPTDEELDLLAEWWADFVLDNEDYRWDGTDSHLVRLRSRRSDREAWLVVETEWDAGKEQEPTPTGCYPSYAAALAAIGL